MRLNSSPISSTRLSLRALSLAFVFSSAFAKADSVYWNQPASGDWLVGSNWSGGFVPTATDFAYLGYDHGSTSFSNPATLTATLTGGSGEVYGLNSRMNLAIGSNSSLSIRGGGLYMESGTTLSLFSDTYYSNAINLDGADQTITGNLMATGYRTDIAASGAGILNLDSSFVANHVFSTFNGFSGISGLLRAETSATISGQTSGGFNLGSSGRLEADGQSANLSYYGQTFDTIGTISAQNGGYIAVGGWDRFNNTSGTIRADGQDANGQASTVQLDGYLKPSLLGDVKGVNGGKIVLVGNIDATATPLDASVFGAAGTLSTRARSLYGSVVNSDLMENAGGKWYGVTTDHGVHADGLHVYDGIGLGDGVIDVSNSSGGVVFHGTQTFGGTIVAKPGTDGNVGISGLLTLGPTGKILSDNAHILLQNNTNYETGSLINQGTIESSAGGTIRCQYDLGTFTNAATGQVLANGLNSFVHLGAGGGFTNEGSILASDGAEMILGGGQVHNTGTILSSGSHPDGSVDPRASHVRLIGSFKTSELGDIRADDGGLVSLRGELDNQGETFDVSRFGTAGSFRFGQTSYFPLRVTGGTLSNVSMAAKGSSLMVDGVSAPGGFRIEDSYLRVDGAGLDLDGGSIDAIGNSWLRFSQTDPFQGTINVLPSTGVTEMDTINGATLGENSRVVVQSGATLRQHFDSSVGGQIATAGEFDVLSGGRFEGAIRRTGGRIKVNGDADTILVEAGTMQGIGFAAYVKSWSVLQPGNSVGTLHIGNYVQTATGTLEMEIASLTSYDVLQAGNLDLAGTLKLDLLDPSLTSSSGLLTLLTYTGSLSGGFDTLVAPQGWSIVYGDHFVGVQTQAVPEPASFAALGLGALAMLRRRRS